MPHVRQIAPSGGEQKTGIRNQLELLDTYIRIEKGENLLLKQILHTNPTSTTLL